MKKNYLVLVLLFIHSLAWAHEKTHENYHNVNQLSFISAQVPVNNKGELVSNEIDTQVQQTFKNLVEIARKAGATIEDGKIKNVAKLNVYLSNINDLKVVDKYLLNYVTSKLPARTPLGGINYGNKGYLIALDAVVELQAK